MSILLALVASSLYRKKVRQINPTAKPGRPASALQSFVSGPTGHRLGTRWNNYWMRTNISIWVVTGKRYTG